MARRSILSFLFTVVLAHTLSASPFSGWNDAFSAAQLPDRDTLLGWWAGECAESNAPDVALPALYVYREIGSSYDSQSHYLNRKDAPDFYEHWTLTQARQDPSIAAWQNAEDWPSVFNQDSSVVNFYEGDTDASALRAVREQKRGDVVTLWMQVSGGNETTNCKFPRRLTDAPPIPSGLLADSGNVEGGEIDLLSRDTQTPFRSLEVINEGSEPVELSGLEVQTASGVYNIPGPFTVDSESSRTFAFTDKAEAIQHLLVNVTGKTKNLRFIGMAR